MRRRTTVLAYSLLVLYAFGLLSIGLTSDWQLIHEDNGAMHTTFALSHLRLGLATTRAHDLFFNPHTGEAIPHVHHPPGPSLVLAGAFAVANSDAPWVARLVAIGFHLGSILLTVSFVTRLTDRRWALVAGFVMATVPMGSFFGRMMNYEPLCLFAVLVQLTSYVAYRQQGGRRALAGLAAGTVLGGLIDWPAYFFGLLIALVEAVDLLRRRTSSPGGFLVVVVSALATFAASMGHLWYAGHGDLGPLRSVLSRDVERLFDVGKTLRTYLQLVDIHRRYLTHTGLVAGVLAAVALARPSSRPGRRLLDLPEGPLVKRVLILTGGAALLYVLAAPDRARVHAYWQFYFLPYVVLSVTLVARALLERANTTRRGLYRVLLAFCLIEIAITSSWMLRFRHTRQSSYAIQETQGTRNRFLAPESRILADPVPSDG